MRPPPRSRRLTGAPFPLLVPKDARRVPDCSRLVRNCSGLAKGFVEPFTADRSRCIVLSLAAPRLHRYVKPTVTTLSSELLGAGIYTIPEAARLSRVSPHRIRRWLKGYTFKTKGTKRLRSAPVWQSQITPLRGTVAVGFRDLMEIRFVAAFIEQGVTWKTMRGAHAAAKETLDTDHPFCTHRFATDGRHILQHEMEEAGDQRFTDIVTNQREFDAIITPFLRELDFEDGVLRWWPLGRNHAVVLDPARNLGQPIVASAGVQTRILANSVKANDGSIEVVARWFEVAAEDVRDAVEFEKTLLAA